MSFRSFEFETANERGYSTLVNSSAEYLQGIKERDRYQILLSLFAVWNTTRKFYDSSLFSVMAEAAFKNNLVDKYSFLDLRQAIEKNEVLSNVSNTMDELPEFVKNEKKKGRTVGLKFGHYRRLTIAQIVELVEAGKRSDSVILIIESDERTRINKTDKIELSDTQRMQILGESGLVNFVGMTSGNDFSNEYYRGVVEFIKPDVLYASSGWDQNMISEYEIRAKIIGAKLEKLPVFTNFSTTHLEKIIF